MKHSHLEAERHKVTLADRFAALGKTLYRGISRFFVSFLFSIFVSFWFSNTSYSDWIYFVTLGLFVSVPTHLLTERLRVPEHRAFIIEIAASVGVGALYMLLDHIGGSTWFEYLYLAFEGILLGCIVASYALLMNRDNEHSLMPTMIEKFIVSISVGVAALLAVGVCLSAFTELLLNLETNIYTRVFAFCILFLPINLFLSMTPKPDETPDSGRSDHRLFSYLLLPFYLVMLAILYGYLFKILLMREMPVGTMNWYASFALFFYLLLYMCVREDGNPLCRPFKRYGGIALIPVIAVQIVGIVIRFNAYGLTTARYLSMILLGHGIAALMLTILKRPLRPVFIMGIINCFIFSCTPFNVIDVPIREQEARLKRILTENGLYQDGQLVVTSTLDEDTLQAIYSCYEYLSDAPTVKRSIFRSLAVPPSNKSFAELYGALPGHERISCHYSCNLDDGFDISGYALIQEFSHYSSTYSPTLTLTYKGIDDSERTVDLTPYAEALRSEHGDEASNVPLVYTPDEQTKLVFSRLSFDLSGDEFVWLSLNGYVLQR